MQRQWTIEARADFAEPAKNDAISEAIRRAAVHVNAIIKLLQDGVNPPQVVAFSDDFFMGHEDIVLLDDALGNAIDEHKGNTGTEPEISDEMLQAVRDMKG